MNLQKNASLIIGLAIPVMMIVFVAASIYIPSMFIHPKQDFLYMTNSYSYSSWQYEVVDGKLTRTKVEQPDNIYKPPLQEEPRFFVHETLSDTNRELTFEEAQALTINKSAMSADGFEFVGGDYGGGFLFFDGSSDRSYYLRGQGARKRVTITAGANRYYDYDIRFLGWITQ